MGFYNAARKIYHLLRKAWNRYQAVQMKRYARRAKKLIPYYQDSISIQWLKARISYSVTKNPCVFAKTGKSLDGYQKYRIDEFCPGGGMIAVVYRSKEDLIYRYTRQVFEMSDFQKSCRFLSEAEYNSRPQSMLRPGEILFPAMDKECMNEFLFAARKKGDWNALVLPRYSILAAASGWQYFDMFAPVSNEIVVDAGSFDGQTESEIFKWGGENIQKIYAFEADPENCTQCRRYFADNGFGSRVQLVEKGAWNKRAVMWIKSAQWKAGSTVSAEGDVQIELTDIDSEVGDDKVTFIKMDIEGSEMEALIGGRKSIVKHKPRMAISVYHKPQDLWELADYILDLNPEYQLYMRHYTTCSYETILYAV